MAPLFKKNVTCGTSLVVQWLRLHASTAGATGVPSLVGELRSHMACKCSSYRGSFFIPSRVTDSDDLIMTENEVGKIALHIEKEMFNLFRVTDNRYKSKYRSLMFNLKDPKNQVRVRPSGAGAVLARCCPGLG